MLGELDRINRQREQRDLFAMHQAEKNFYADEDVFIPGVCIAGPAYQKIHLPVRIT